MSFHEILIAVMAGFAVLGAADRILGNPWGLGKEFEEGILAMGSLALAMVGIVSLAPVLANVLKPVVVPLYSFLGADPAMFAGTILACDMGGGALAAQMTQDPRAALLGGVLNGSMLGATIVFTIPVAMGILREEDRPAMAKGILCGIVTIPLGVLVGGLTAGFPPGMVLRNLIPIVLIAILISLGLWRAERAMVKGFALFGKIVVAVVTVGLAAAIVEALTGMVIIPGMAPIEEGFETVGVIAILLAGAFPLVFVLTRLLRKPLLAAGKWLGINDTAAAGLIASLANSIATFGMVKDMNERGKVVNIAFAVSAAFVFGDHLGFTAGFAPEMIGPMIAGKLVGGISAVAVAMWLTGKDEARERSRKNQ
ncbi:MAG: ethanolamine utilization protein EutH [Oscillospiraceae bacterium]|nr:ethanolamine utilization protein EutH [Oscillospiraceae bacterium]